MREHLPHDQQGQSNSKNYEAMEGIVEGTAAMKKINLKNTVFSVLLIVSILSIILNIFLYQQTRKYYALLYTVELDPLGLSHFQNSVEQQINQQPVAVFFGDSRAAQWTNPDKVSFPRILVWSNDVDAAVKEVNDYILSLASEKIIVFDSALILSSDEGKIRPEYKYDLLHLNSDGYQALNPELMKILQKLK